MTVLGGVCWARIDVAIGRPNIALNGPQWSVQEEATQLPTLNGHCVTYTRNITDVSYYYDCITIIIMIILLLI